MAIKKIFKALVCFSLFLLTLFPAALAQAEETKVAPRSGSIAWQLDELFNWLVQARYLVPRAKECDGPCYILTSLQLNGSASTNAFTFTARGHVLANRAVQVLLFGPPEQIILRQVTLNGQPAVVGFQDNQYYVRTAEKQFTVSGEFSLTREFNLQVPGPITLFTSAISGGKVAEGSLLPGVENMTLHIERTGAGAPKEAEVEPYFQLSRAFRVQKEINFEYHAQLQSPHEMTVVTLPLKLGETVLDVAGFRGWKQEGGILTVPVAGRTAEFTVTGRLAALGVVEPDERSSYEWVLVEADPEHRISVTTTAPQIDSTESPLSCQLPLSKLFLLSKGQRLETKVQNLVAREALSVVISKHSRLAVWTSDGDLVFQDQIDYQNNGLDFVPLKSGGKNLYLDIDAEPQKILGQDEKNDEIMLPMQKGRHKVRLQGITTAKKGFLFGLLPLPFPDYPLTISQAVIEVDTPSGIHPLWLFGGEGYANNMALSWVINLLLSLLISMVLFRRLNIRIAATIFLFGLFLFSLGWYILVLIIFILIFLFIFISRRYQSFKRWLVFGFSIVGILIFGTILLSFLAGLQDFSRPAPSSGMQWDLVEMWHSGYDGPGLLKELMAIKIPQNPIQNEAIQNQQVMEQKRSDSQTEGYAETRQVAKVLMGKQSKILVEKNMVEGMKPVPIPLPLNHNNLSRFWVQRTLVRPERPFTPKLLYMTATAHSLLLLIWLSCLAFIGWNNRLRLLDWKNRFSLILFKKEAPPNTAKPE